MKKILWQVLALVVLVGGGYGLLRLYPNLLQSADDGVWVPPLENATASVDPGTYVLFQTTRVIDRGTEDRANDDVTSTELWRYPITGAATPTLIAAVDADETFDGSPWAEVVGQGVWFHRFTAVGDAFLDLDGSSQELSGSWIANRDGSVMVKYTMEYENRGATITMIVGTRDYVIDQATLGIDFGYGQPFMVSDDGSSVYIRQICDCDASGLTGFWVFDVATQKLRSITYLGQKGVHEFQVNPTTQQLIGASWTPAEGMGEAPFGPSVLYLVDLKTGGGRILQSEPDDSLTLGHPFLSSDGTHYAFDLYDGIIRTAEVGKPNTNYVMTTGGRLLDWIGDDMILERDGTLWMENPVTGDSRPLAESVADYNDPDYTGWQYVGVITKN